MKDMSTYILDSQIWSYVHAQIEDYRGGYSN